MCKTIAFKLSFFLKNIQIIEFFEVYAVERLLRSESLDVLIYEHQFFLT